MPNACRWSVVFMLPTRLWATITGREAVISVLLRLSQFDGNWWRNEWFFFFFESSATIKGNLLSLQVRRSLSCWKNTNWQGGQWDTHTHTSQHTRWCLLDKHRLEHFKIFVARVRPRGDSWRRFHAAAAAAAAAALNGVILSGRLVKRGNGDTPAQSHTFPLILTFR